MRSGVAPGSNGPASATLRPSTEVRGEEPGSTVTPCAPAGNSSATGSDASTATCAGLLTSKT